ncbi:MAG TPA: hypothetical protein VLD39_00550, partial [Gammaproteobacteria bacterium]|nr:hypothetical protein [Gammaproteobacteria bacterium]
VVISALAAIVLLVTVVLPAEYGIDPLGAGRALGLDMLSGAAELAPVPPPQGDALAPVREGQVALYPAAYRYDARALTLGPYEYLEFKYRLAEGATMLFAWTASGNVLHDFHGDREGAAANAAVSFDSRPRREAYGSFSAPFSGIHGWYWENPGGSTITVQLTTAGFYTEAHEFHYDGSRVTRELRGLDTLGLSRD